MMSTNKLARFLAPVVLIMFVAIGIYAVLALPKNETELDAYTASSQSVDAVEAVSGETDALETALQNLTFTPFGNEEPITLTNGKNDDTSLMNYEVGDLNGDGVDDVAFVVATIFEDSVLPEVGVAIGDGNGSLSHVANELLFPDADVQLSIVGSQLIVEIGAPDFNVPSTTYIVANGRLIQPDTLASEAEADARYHNYFATEWNLGDPTPEGSLLTRDTLSNMVYQIEDTRDGTAALLVGTYREAPRTAIRLLPQHTYGDLNGDGEPEAVVLLAMSTGGSGTFISLVIVTSVAGQPQQIDSVSLGDRVQIQTLTVENETLTVVYDEVTQQYVLRDGVLEEISE